MARTYNKPGSGKASAPKATSVKAAEEKAVTRTDPKPAAEPKAEAAIEPVKASASVIAAPDTEVMHKVVYQPSSQILEREVAPNESFGVGDDMPVYYL
ncbi:MAG: hypothetical protein K6G42_05285 [Lachnospiraceae bacterium]|nr:hypothetical protein [Lachnospiraceae bacterium]